MSPLRRCAALVAATAVSLALVGCGRTAETSGSPDRPANADGRVARGDATRFVSTTGNDANTGSQDKPWLTIARGLRDARPGTTLVLAGGAYVGPLTTTQAGTRDAPIVIRSAPGQRAELRAAGQDRAIEVASGSAFVVFDAIDFTGATGASSTNIYVSGSAHDITFRSCEVSGSQRQGFFSERTTRAVQVVGCSFHDNGGAGPDNLDHNLYVEGEDHLIVNNIIASARNGYGIQLYPLARNVVVANNTTIVVASSPAPPATEAKRPSRHVTAAPSSTAPSPSSSVAAHMGTCSACGDAVRGRVVHALGASFHPDHFTCTVCRRVIAAHESFAADTAHPQRPLCTGCSSSRRADLAAAARPVQRAGLARSQPENARG